MKYLIEVKRNRISVTQGYATVYVNGEEMISFGEEIKLIRQSEKYYGEMIDGWASTKPDEAFIKGMLFHPFDRYYRCSEKFRNMLDKAIGVKEEHL